MFLLCVTIVACIYLNVILAYYTIIGTLIDKLRIILVRHASWKVSLSSEWAGGSARSYVQILLINLLMLNLRIWRLWKWRLNSANLTTESISRHKRKRTHVIAYLLRPVPLKLTIKFIHVLLIVVYGLRRSNLGCRFNLDLVSHWLILLQTSI